MEEGAVEEEAGPIYDETLEEDYEESNEGGALVGEASRRRSRPKVTYLTDCKTDGWIDGTTYVLKNSITTVSSACFRIDQGKDITLNCNTKLIDGMGRSNTAFWIGNSEGITIKHCPVRNFKSNALVVDLSKNVLITNNVFESSKGGIMSRAMGDYTVARNNVFKQNTIRQNSGYGISLHNTRGYILENNLISNNIGGIHIQHNTKDINVRRNSIFANEKGIYFTVGSKDSIVTDNKLLNNEVDVYCDSKKTQYHGLPTFTATNNQFTKVSGCPKGSFN